MLQDAQLDNEDHLSDTQHSLKANRYVEIQVEFWWIPTQGA